MKRLSYLAFDCLFIILMAFSIACSGDDDDTNSSDQSTGPLSSDNTQDIVSSEDSGASDNFVQVVSSDPANLSIGVAVSKPILIYFSRAIKLPDSSSIELAPQDTPEARAETSVSLTEDGMLLTVTPLKPLEYEITYRMNVTANISGKNGEYFDQNPKTPTVYDTYIISFTTQSAPCLAQPPEITGVDPDSGTLSGSQEVTIYGTGFTTAESMRVLFGGVEADISSIVAGTDSVVMTVLSPLGITAGPVNVYLETCAGNTTCAGCFTYRFPPTITEVIENKGPVEGGQRVTIIGGGFTTDNDTKLYFGPNEATDVRVVPGQDQIMATIPAYAYPISVDVRIENANGIGNLVNGYTYQIPVSDKVGSIVINEVVADPQFEWNDTNSGDNVPFNAVPGDNNPDSSDEWIELKNVSGEPMNIKGWSLMLVDSENAIQPFDLTDTESRAIFRFSGGGDFKNYQMDEYLVVGDPAGSMDESILVILVDELGKLVDRVEIGNVKSSPPEDDGAPEVDFNANATSAYNEAIARASQDGTDGNDSDPKEVGVPDANSKDWVKRSSTILRNNAQGVGKPGSIVINEVVADPKSDWSDSVTPTPRGEPFDDQPGAGIPRWDDQWIELYNPTDEEVNINGWLLAMRDSVPYTLILEPGDTNFKCSGGSSINSFKPDTYCIYGNPSVWGPAAIMEKSIFIQLKDAAGFDIDNVEIGDDNEYDGAGDGAPGELEIVYDETLNIKCVVGSTGSAKSSTPTNEAVARYPNGTDTDPNEDSEPVEADAHDFIQRSATIMKSNDAGVIPYMGDVVINEVNTDPQSDWDGQVGCRNFNTAPVAFDPYPCAGREVGGAVDNGDQYVELYNKMETPVDPEWPGCSDDPVEGCLDYTGWTVVMHNGQFGTNVNTEYLGMFGEDMIEATLYNSSDNATGKKMMVGPQQYLVVGNPEGILYDQVFVELRDGLGCLMDNVELGDNPEGDIPGDGIEDGGDAYRKSTTESVSRCPNGIDSDVYENLGEGDADKENFSKHSGTPGIGNQCGNNPVYGSIIINEVVTEPVQDWSDTAGGRGVPFDDKPGNGMAGIDDEYVELYINQEGLDLTFGYTIVVKNDMVQDPTGGIDFQGSLNADDIKDRAFSKMYYSSANGGSLSYTMIGDYLVLGNPSGAADTGFMSNNVYITIQAGNQLIDDVELGYDAEGDKDEKDDNAAPDGRSYGKTSQESVSRRPNATDTDNDESDFKKQVATPGLTNNIK
jgi:hypothetical protein